MGSVQPNISSVGPSPCGDRHNNNFQNGKCIENCLNKDDKPGTQSPTKRQLYGENDASSMQYIKSLGLGYGSGWVHNTSVSKTIFQ